MPTDNTFISGVLHVLAALRIVQDDEKKERGIAAFRMTGKKKKAH